jgi:hypothetical protein
MVRSTTIATIGAALLGGIVLIQGQAPAGQPPAAPPSVQQPAAQQPSQQKPPQPSEKAETKVTVAGCLKPGTLPGSWTLENVEMASAAPAGAETKPGEKGTAGTAGTKKTYTLSVKPGEDLKAHTNHKIEVTGTVSQASTAPSTTPGAVQGVTPPQTFNMESFKMVSATCP